ncbi:GntR family transcriptional regulator [Sinomonas sp. ASV486]|uniref:FadR/GntR family transcriptional regulator n=1 Tax=Sinomonas sp. ASV486 TaxID=3051170 RepID=UPI0027DD84D5|nr:GntR family transcriptional regulator [Sinomonas sp. ASV486]MDQ4489134.1 GntR family transcriptional regulator [Sinomonas sp. ASV486]
MAPSIAFQSQIYRPLPEMERADSIVDRISKAITLGMLRVGERLPTEADLSEKFGVAAATLRDALAELRDQGIVETRRGRNGGTFIVKQPTTSPDEMRVHLASVSIADIRDFGDEHVAVAAETVRLACERAEPHEVERLLELGRALVFTNTPEGRAQADSRFHIELAVTAQSPRLTSAEIRLQAESVQLLWAPLAHGFDSEQAAAEHLALVRAVSEDRPDDAQRLMRLHVRRAVHHLIDTKLALEYSAAMPSDDLDE